MLQHSQEEWFVQREYNCLVRWYHDVYHAADTQCENVGDLRRCYEMHDRTNSGWPSALPTAHCGRRRDGMMCPAKYIAFPIDQIWPDEAYLVIGWLPIPDWIALILFLTSKNKWVIASSIVGSSWMNNHFMLFVRNIYFTQFSFLLLHLCQWWKLKKLFYWVPF